MSNSKFKNIRAYRVGWLLPFVDFLILYPALLVMRRKTTKGIQLCFQGDRKRIEQDIRHGNTSVWKAQGLELSVRDHKENFP